eukprot:PhM_4_TR7506/c0_g1_i1/m.99741
MLLRLKAKHLEKKRAAAAASSTTDSPATPAQSQSPSSSTTHIRSQQHARHHQTVSSSSRASSYARDDSTTATTTSTQSTPILSHSQHAAPSPVASPKRNPVAAVQRPPRLVLRRPTPLANNGSSSSNSSVGHSHSAQYESSAAVSGGEADTSLPRRASLSSYRPGRYLTRRSVLNPEALEQMYPSPRSSPHVFSQLGRSDFVCCDALGTQQTSSGHRFIIPCAVCRRYSHSHCVGVGARGEVGPNFMCKRCERETGITSSPMPGKAGEPTADTPNPKKRGRSPEQQRTGSSRRPASPTSTTPARRPPTPPQKPPPAVSARDAAVLKALQQQLEQYLVRRTPCELVPLGSHAASAPLGGSRSSSSKTTAGASRTSKNTPQAATDKTSPPSSSGSASGLSDEAVRVLEEQCLAACSEAIDNGTFAADYPIYCLGQLLDPPLFDGVTYMQGACIRDRETHEIVAWIHTNARDDTTNFKATVTSLRTQRTRHPELMSTTMELFSRITNYAEFYHVNILATHNEHRGRGYGKVLLLHCMIYWALRGYTKSFLNMALEKVVNEDTGKVECRPSHSSLSLYRKFDFLEAYPKYNANGTFRWTQAEADMGRLMINADTGHTIVRMSALFGLPAALSPDESGVDGEEE